MTTRTDKNGNTFTNATPKRKRARPAPTAPMVGISVTAEPVAALAAAKAAIIEILSVDRAGDEPKAQAMKTLRALAKSQPLTIDGCTFYGTDTGVHVQGRR